MTEPDPDHDWRMRRLFRWRLALAWVAVAIIATHYLIHPVATVALVYAGQPPLPPLEPMSWSDLAAIVGSPLAGAWADRVAGEP